MRYVFIIGLLCVSTLSFAQEISDQEQSRAAREILQRWQREQPKSEERTLHLICWTPADRDLPDDYQDRLTRIMKNIQQFYRLEMARHGFPNHTIRLPIDKKQSGEQTHLMLHTATGEHPAAHYNVQSGQEVRRDCVAVLQKAGIDPQRETIVIFCNLATWDEAKLAFKHKSPYYASGSFRSGTAWQLDSPELDAKSLALTEPMMQDGQYGHISIGKHNSIFIGGIAHELGHALGLPHCRQRPDEAVRGTALMGSGNRTYGDQLRGEGRGSFLTLAHALRLASHPMFSGSTKAMGQNAAADIDELSIQADGKAIEVSGVVSGSPPIYAVVAYFDPSGGSDYDATTASAVPDADGRFTIRSKALTAGKAGALRLFPLHVNGSAAGQMSRTRFRYPYRIAADGTPDLSTLQIRRELQPLVDAIAAGHFGQARQSTTKIQLPKAAAIAKRLLNSDEPNQSPAQFDGDQETQPLTNFKPLSAKVGWGRPAFDRVPDKTVLLESGDQVFETGIYAHAPSQHTYELGGKWRVLRGKVGLATGHPGSVRFQITCDGKSQWQSKLIRPGEIQKFTVNVDDIKKVQMLTDTTPDGAGADWALWLEPTLER